MGKKLFYKKWWGILILTFSSFFLFPFYIGGLLLLLVNKKITNKILKYSLYTLISLPTLLIGGIYLIAWLTLNNEQKKDRVLSESTSFKLLISPKEIGTSPSSIPTPFSLIPSGQSTNFEEAKVIQVIDGDTIQLEGGKKVRYIGINTPETVHPQKPVECYGREASDKNKELVGEKTIYLGKDVSESDKDGRYLRYVYVGDIFVNEYLVREGYAVSSTYPPDVKYQNLFIEAQRKAREEGKGLWSSYCDSLQQATPTIYKYFSPTPYIKSSQIPSSDAPIAGYTCNCSKTCSQIISCEEANYQLSQCSCYQRDGDGDGVPCENLCSGGTSSSSFSESPEVETQSSEDSSYICNCGKTCTQISSCDEAYFQLNKCGCLKRDGDNDGIPCESICK